MVYYSDKGEGKREDEFDLRGYFHVLKKRYRYMVGFFLVVVLSTLILIQTRQPYYRATTQLLVERNNQAALVTQYGYIHDPNFVNTQLEVIKSKNVIHRVISNLELDTKYREHFLKEEQQQGKVARLKEALLGSVSKLIPRQQDSADLEAAPGHKTDTDKIAKAILEELSVEPIYDTNVIDIAFDHPSPEIARMLVNAIAESYMDELLEVRMKQAGRAVSWMSKKAEEERKKLEEAEQALQDYTRQNDLISEEDKLDVIPQQLKEYSTLLSQARAKRKELEDIHEQIEQLGEDYEAIENLPEFAENKDLQVVREKMFQVEQNMAALSKKIGEKHPDMIKARQEYDLLRSERKFLVKRLAASVAKEYELAKSNEKNFEQLLADTKLELVNINEKLIQHNILKREVESNRILYEALIAKMKETRATEQTQMVNVAILEYAAFPEKPARPKKTRNMILAIIIGLFGGVGLAALREHLDNTISSVRDLEGHFSLPVLGVVESFADTDAALGNMPGGSSRLRVAESYKMIRAELALLPEESRPKILLVTSGAAGEGKTTTCVNLAKAMALDGKLVVIVDADLRAPRVHSLFQLNNQTGLSPYLAQGWEEDVVIDSPYPGLNVVPAGPIPDNPTELLGSERFKKLLEDLTLAFDYILIDSTDLLTVSDARVLATRAEATVLVVRSGKTTREELNAVQKKIERTDMRLAGVVLNGGEL